MHGMKLLPILYNRCNYLSMLGLKLNHVSKRGHRTEVPLTHWGRVAHICVGNLTIIGSDNGLSPGRCQAIIWINAGILLIGPLGTNLSEILIEIRAFLFKKMHLKTSSGKWTSSCLGLNVLMAPRMRCHIMLIGNRPYLCSNWGFVHIRDLIVTVAVDIGC